MKIIEYDDNCSSMRRFVYQAYTLSNDGADAGADLYHWLRDENNRCIVGTNDGDALTFQGFALKVGDRLTWVYVKRVVHELAPTERMEWEARGMRVKRLDDGSGLWMLRHNGVAKELLKELGFTKDRPLPVYHDNAQAQAWKERGWDVKFS